MEIGRELGAGIAALSLSEVALTMGVEAASGQVAPPRCSTPGASGVAVANAYGAPLSCSTGHLPSGIKRIDF